MADGKLYLRYKKETGTFDFKMEYDGKTVLMAEDKDEIRDMTAAQLAAVREGFLTLPKGDLMAELFDCLVIEAKKDPEGRYVSASSAKVVSGQAVVGTT